MINVYIVAESGPGLVHGHGYRKQHSPVKTFRGGAGGDLDAGCPGSQNTGNKRLDFLVPMATSHLPAACCVTFMKSLHFSSL